MFRNFLKPNLNCHIFRQAHTLNCPIFLAKSFYLEENTVRFVVGEEANSCLGIQSEKRYCSCMPDLGELPARTAVTFPVCQCSPHGSLAARFEHEDDGPAAPAGGSLLKTGSN